MTRMATGLLTACLLLAASSVAAARGNGCPPPPPGPVLPALQPSAEGIWRVAVGSGLPIVFVHGWTMDHRDEAWDYEPVLQRRGGWRRIYVDLPGMGRSAATTVRDQDEILERLLAFVDREVPAGRFAIAGTSAGAYLAQALAERRRDRVAGLLLRMPMTVPDDRKRDRDAAEVLVPGKAATGTGDEASPAIVQGPCYVASLRHKNRARVEAAQSLANRSVLDPIRNDPSRYSLSASPRPPGAPLAAPVLIIAGRQDTSVGYRDAWRHVARYPRATYVALDRAEHGFPIDRSNRALFESLVEDWLDRIEEVEGRGGVRESPPPG